MTTWNIAVIVGSLRKDSFTRKVAQSMIELAPASLNLEIVEIRDLPLYNQDDETDMDADTEDEEAAEEEEVHKHNRFDLDDVDLAMSNVTIVITSEQHTTSHLRSSSRNQRLVRNSSGLAAYYSSGTPSPAAPGDDCVMSAPDRSNHSIDICARRTFSRPINSASACRCMPDG
jgi:hypothetical protein